MEQRRTSRHPDNPRILCGEAGHRRLHSKWVRASCRTEGPRPGKFTRFSAPIAALIKSGALKAPGSNGLVVVMPNRAARRPPGHAGHAAWRPRSADDGLRGVAFEPNTDGAHGTGSRCIR